jgi:hypothetical protein
MKSGNLNFLEPSGPLQACNGTALPFYLLCSLFPWVYRPSFSPNDATFIIPHGGHQLTQTIPTRRSATVQHWIFKLSSGIKWHRRVQTRITIRSYEGRQWHRQVNWDRQSKYVTSRPPQITSGEGGGEVHSTLPLRRWLYNVNWSIAND